VKEGALLNATGSNEAKRYLSRGLTEAVHWAIGPRTQISDTEGLEQRFESKARRAQHQRIENKASTRRPVVAHPVYATNLKLRPPRRSVRAAGAGGLWH
jgi:hypothetical protein